MALTNTQYDTIIREYNKKQLQNRRDQEARIALAEKELPELSQINGEIASLSMKCARRLLEGEAASIDDLKTEIAAYGIHRKALLKNAGFPEDFLEMHYSCPDCKDTGYIGTAHLLEHGHKTVAYLGIHHSGTRLRKNGWKRALQDYGAGGISIDLQSLEGSAERLKEILRKEKVTALFCSNDFLAGKVMRCLSMSGWDIPGDIAVAGCDGNSFIEYTTPTLTTVIQPIHQIAEQCAELILERIRKKINGVILSKIDVTPKLWTGGSCGCSEHPIRSLYRINSTGSLEKEYRLNFNHSLWDEES